MTKAFGRLGFTVAPAESASAAWELMRVAEGRVGVAVMRHFHGHDTAMASVIIESLGGKALQGDGQAVRYDKEMPRLPKVVLSVVPEYASELASV